MEQYLNSASLLLVLLNPFLVIIYIIDVVQKLKPSHFYRAMIRAGCIAAVVFCLFANLGDAVFSKFLQADFASFQIFGGLIFLIIGLQFVFHGPTAIEILRGESENLAGAIAMPVLIGPGTISASVVIGKRHSSPEACLIVVVAVVVTILIMILLKRVHDFVRPRNEYLIQRYIEVAGRIMALIVGTVSVEMIMQGLRAWAEKF